MTAAARVEVELAGRTIPVGGGDGPFCERCGVDLSLSQEQIDWVIEHGNPIPRPPCLGGRYHRLTSVGGGRP